MYKFILSSLLIFTLVGCASPEKKIKQGKIEIGMSKYAFCYETLSWSGPCEATFMDGFDNKGRGLYYPNLKMEILWAPKPKSFFVFKKVTQPINWANYGKRMYEGNGELDKIFKNKEEAIKYVSTKVSVVNKNDMNFAIKQCKEKGLKQGTEEFADCALKRLKENN